MEFETKDPALCVLSPGGYPTKDLVAWGADGLTHAKERGVEEALASAGAAQEAGKREEVEGKAGKELDEARVRRQAGKGPFEVRAREEDVIGFEILEAVVMEEKQNRKKFRRVERARSRSRRRVSQGVLLKTDTKRVDKIEEVV
jgi:hypothetical protein